jgi:hypothetical protein
MRLSRPILASLALIVGWGATPACPAQAATVLLQSSSVDVKQCERQCEDARDSCLKEAGRRGQPTKAECSKGFKDCISKCSPSAGAQRLQASGKISFLRVHDVGSGFGPPSDFIDVEVVIQLNTKPGESFGFQLRADANRAARQGMLDLLRDAFNNNWTVTIDYDITPPKKNGVIVRVAVVK